MRMASSPPPPWRNSTKSAEESQNCVRGGILPNTLKTRNLKCTLWETLIQMQFPSTWQKCLFLEQANIILIPKWNAIRLSANKTGITRWDGSSMLRSVVRWRESQFPVLHVKDPAPGRIWWHSIDWGIKKAVSLSPARSIWLCQDILCKHAVSFWSLSGVPTVHQLTACPGQDFSAHTPMKSSWKVKQSWIYWWVYYSLYILQ